MNGEKLIGFMEEEDGIIREYHLKFGDNEQLKRKINPKRNKLYDRESKKVILVNYKQGAGGNFLINCLCLSSSIESKREFKILNTLEKKIDYIKNGMNKINIKELNWKDVSLCDRSEEIVNGDFSGVAFFKSHDTYHLNQDLNFWINPKVIIFKNCSLFCYLRSCIWNIDNGDKTYQTYCEYSIKKFLNLNKNKQKLIKSYFQDEKYDYKNFEKNDKFLYVWDTNWYLSLDETLFHLNEIYKLLNLEDFNEEIISWYYEIWIDKMEQMKNQLIEKKSKNFEN
jgi:hypothetical protein